MNFRFSWFNNLTKTSVIFIITGFAIWVYSIYALFSSGMIGGFLLALLGVACLVYGQVPVPVEAEN